MNDRARDRSARDRAAFSRDVAAQAARKLSARRNPARNVWFGLGMMGLIGWSVVVPTLLGAALGVWLDRRNPGQHFWTVTFLFIGVAIGSWNAWQWMARQQKQMREEQEQHD